ncbi:hypothetical protein D3C81_1734980 [compost metagenome]
MPTAFSQSSRNRPSELSNATAPTRSQLIAQATSERSTGAGKVSAEEIARMTFDGIRERDFYIFSHPQAMPLVKERFDAVLYEGTPGDPFAGKPEVRANLVAALRG